MKNADENLSHPLASQWQSPQLVERFRTAAPNDVLMEYARSLQRQGGETALRVLDIGGGAARNAVPLAQLGMEVCCTDLSAPMLDAAQQKIQREKPTGAVGLVQAPMFPLPFRDRQFDLIVAHGIWNLAHSGTALRRAVSEAARVAKPGASLFLFTFSRHTLPDGARPLAGEKFVFTQFSGDPQCFLTEEEILDELLSAGFARAPAGPLTEHNRPAAPVRKAQRPPVIYEGTFVRR